MVASRRNSRIKVRARFTAIVAGSAWLLTACSFFVAHPFPDYIAGIEKRIDISDRIDTVRGTAASARYEIATVSTPAGDRVLLLIEPSVAEPAPGSPVPQLLLFSRTLDYIGTIVPESPLGYAGRPFAYAADGNILSGDTVFDPDGSSVALTLNPSGLSGFGFSTPGTTTYVLSLPPGESASTQLVLSTYDVGWSAPVDHYLEITSSTNLYFSLEGARLEDDGDTLTIAVKNSSTAGVYVAHASLAAVVSDAAPALLDETAEPTIDGSDSTVYYTANDIVLRRSSGYFEHYTSDGSSMTGKVTAERRTGVVYGFSPDGRYLYRLDPATGSFSLIRTWW